MDYQTLLEQGINYWNQWRSHHPKAACTLEGQDLSHGYFFEGNFEGVNLRGANLQRACLVGANFRSADLTGADLTGAYLGDASFYGANLSHANFAKTALERADMRRANLLGTQLTDTDIRSVKFSDATLDPYGNEIAYLLSQPQVASLPNLKTTVEKSSLVRRIAAQLKMLIRAKSETTADWQQDIRLSAVPGRSR